jgi:hypothetical protein
MLDGACKAWTWTANRNDGSCHQSHLFDGIESRGGVGTITAVEGTYEKNHGGTARLNSKKFSLAQVPRKYFHIARAAFATIGVHSRHGRPR